MRGCSRMKVGRVVRHFGQATLPCAIQRLKHLKQQLCPQRVCCAQGTRIDTRTRRSTSMLKRSPQMPLSSQKIPFNNIHGVRELSPAHVTSQVLLHPSTVGPLLHHLLLHLGTHQRACNGSSQQSSHEKRSSDPRGLTVTGFSGISKHIGQMRVSLQSVANFTPLVPFAIGQQERVKTRKTRPAVPSKQC